VTQLQPEPSPTIEMWFEFGSVYSYLSVMRIGDLARQHGAVVACRPFLLGPIFKSFGWETSPLVLQKAKGAYVWRDIARQCQKYHIPWRQPSHFPRRALLPMRVALLGQKEPWILNFCQRVMQMNFVEDREIDSPEVVAEVLSRLSPNPAELLEAAQSEGNKLRLREQTEEARQRGIFGAPTFLVGSEMFWGNDRLEDALSLVAGSTNHKPQAKGRGADSESPVRLIL
jgi:2-hydroxychromene-2-carboxylate isomerase